MPSCQHVKVSFEKFASVQKKKSAFPSISTNLRPYSTCKCLFGRNVIEIKFISVEFC